MSRATYAGPVHNPTGSQGGLGLLLSAPLVFDGISLQPSHVRRGTQVQDALNGLFSVRDGFKRRAGLHLVQHLYTGVAEGLLPAGNNQLQIIGRNRGESYLVVHNRTASGASIRILDIQSNLWSNVESLDASVDAYLNSASPDAFRFRPYLDKTLILNTDVTVAGSQTTGTITANTAANPTVISSTAHGLATGNVVTISGSNSTPSIDGDHVITVINANSFSVPVEVTVAGTTGTWHYGAIDATTMPVIMTRAGGYQSGAVTSNTLANPTVVTSVGHRLVSGQTVIITGSNSTPSIDGERVVTVIDADTFSVAVNVTVAGTSGSWTARAYFTIDLIAWNERAAGSSVSNPLPKLWTEGKKLADACWWMNRLFLFGDEFIMASQDGDQFNFWTIDPAAGLSDRDPISGRVQGLRYAPIDHGQPVRGGIWITSRTGHQFIFRPGQILSPTNYRIDPTTSFAIEPARPAIMEPNLYVAIKAGDDAEVIELLASDSSFATGGRNVCAHVPGLIPMQPFSLGTHEPGTIRTIESMPDAGLVFVLRRDKLDNGQVIGRKLYVYRTHYGSDANGREATIQQAWSVIEFEGVTGIHDIAVNGTDLYLLVHFTRPATSDFEFFIARWSPLGEAENRAFEAPTEQTTFVGLNT